ncbi:hypothetical protein L861_15715 [Litchfieldella anticariensis FP35 = DSM 16096]|uniref:DUF4236 domain-containing protein n=1 Tax=Litchfieldella anticariensis (strain DSM 16096 / CECT 5854 / CIP 108499 / LMG 22089 / FP35) TaxID=1121939 RepID=S2LBP5_LITA3|nr:DUF4236 domain-containing protein [Halomonas anticariensis]EPC02156.1 hypothetical protein L861_15715 [Halomonas anticariensis FP35 = DSM 16096]
MGFRFQRHIRLAPGARLDVSKSELRLSAGPFGASLAGVSGSERSPVRTLEGLLKEGGSLPIRLEINKSGNIRYRHGDGTPMGAHEARLLRRHAGNGIREQLSAHCERLNADLESLALLYAQTPPPGRHTGYQPRHFPEPPPAFPIRQQPTRWQQLWPATRHRIEEENIRREKVYEEAYRAWEWDKAEHDSREFAREQRETHAVLSNLEAMEQTLTERFEEIPWPRETAVDFDFTDDACAIALDIDLPGEDEMPDRQWTMPAKRLKLTPRRLSVTRQRKLYSDYVHGAAFFILGTVFARLPKVERAVVSGYRLVTDPATGSSRDQYLYSIKITRKEWERFHFDQLEQVGLVHALEIFTLRRDMTKTGIFNEIEPFELD